MSNVVIDGVEYAPVAPPSGDIKIVILQRGWVMVGHFSRDGDMCELTHACTIRRWGTTKGLGEIATGPIKGKTVLDPSGGRVQFHILTTVAMIEASQTWAKSLS